MNKLRSSAITQGVQRSPNRSMLRAVGFNDKRLFEDESLYSDIGKIFIPIFYISSYLEI